MASHFTRSLCALKHNGAIDKTQQGFTALCERLLQQPDPALCALPQRCLHQLLAFARRPGQGRSDIVRRSGEAAATPPHMPARCKLPACLIACPLTRLAAVRMPDGCCWLQACVRISRPSRVPSCCSGPALWRGSHFLL